MKRTTNITHVAFALFASAMAICSTAVAFPVMQPSSGPYAANPNPPAGHAIGSKQVLIIRVQFPDAAETTTQSAIESYMATVAQFYQTSSFGRVTLTTTVTSQVYTLPQLSAYYVTRATISDCLTALMSDAIAAAPADYAVDQTGGNWDRVGVCYATIPNVTGQKISGDYGSYGTKFFWITTPQGAGVIKHEIGHTFGARHANLWQVTDGNPVSPNGTSVEYADTFDVMGGAAGYSSNNADFSEWRKWQWGWIDDSQVTVVSAPGIYQFRLFRFDDPLATGLMAIKVQRGDGSNIWIGIRRAWTNKPLEMTGAYIILGYDVAANFSNLIDCNTPNSNISDSALQVGQTLNDALHGITITPLATGGSDPDQYMDVQVTKDLTPTPSPSPTATPATSPTPTPTPTPTPNGITFITSNQPGTLRNDSCGFFGMGITVGQNPITVTALGRLVAPGNSQVHTVEIVDPVSGTAIASTTVNTQGIGVGTFAYGNLASPMTLSANATYYILSQETSSGDQWYDFNTTVTTTLDASLIGAVSGVSAPYSFPNGTLYPNQGYVPLDFTYTLVSPSPTPTPTATPTATPTPTPTIQVTVQTNPAGLSFTVDGTAFSSTQTFSWTSGSSHAIATTSPQSGGTGIQYVWKSWSDNGAISHTVAPTSSTTYTANFTTQYYLTMTHGTGGTVTPSSGWKNSGAAVSITAKPTNGYTFSNWTGTGTGSYSGTNNRASITIGGPITETAGFSHK